MAYIDFRYPAAFNLNRSAEMPSSFGPPNMSAMFQSGISALADPIVARMKEQQALAETAKSAAAGLQHLEKLYTPTPTSSTPAAARPQTATTGTPAGDDPGGPMSGVASSQVRDTFMNTVKNAPDGVTNPYGLAAVAATGQSESTWSPGRLTTSWNDKGKPSGGAMSWRDSGPGSNRLTAMREFTRGAEDPAAAQAQFFLKENPQLIAALNAARSPEEANALMANAWRYEGYKGGTEFYKREALTKRFAAQLGDPAPAPAPAPQAAFAPTVAPAPTPQAAAAVAPPQAPQQAPQQGTQQQGRQPDPQAAMQQQVVSGVEQGDQVINDRLQATRQAGQTRVASLDPSTGIAPRSVPTSREGAAPPDVAATSSIPMVPPAALPRPAPAASAPTAPAGPAEPPVGPAGVPTPDRAAVLQAHDAAVADALRRGDRARADQLSAMRPAIAGAGAPGPAPRPAPGPAPVTPEPPPIQVAQAAGLPGAISGAQRGGIDRSTAEFLLRNARSPEEVSKIIAAVAASQQPPEQKGNRFDLKHDAKGNWYRVDQLTGAVTPVPPPGGAARDPEAWTKEKDLREKFDSEPETRKYRVSQNAYDLVRTHAEAGNGVGDVSLIYAYMKLLDPDTGIREGEFALAGTTGSVPDRIVNVYNNALSGTRLSDKQRKQFVDEAGRALQVRHNQIDKHAGWVRNVARKEKLDPDNILRLEPYQFKTWDPPVDPNTGRKRDDPGGVDPERAASAPGRTPQTAVEVSPDPNMAARQLRQLPAGTWWIGPDGRPRQKGRE